MVHTEFMDVYELSPYKISHAEFQWFISYYHQMERLKIRFPAAATLFSQFCPVTT